MNLNPRGNKTSYLGLKISTLCLFAFLTFTAQAVKMPTLFADNMVLQQNELVPIWGWGHPGEMITIITSWGDSLVVRTENSSKWKAELKTPAGSYDPQTIYICGNAKDEAVFLRNVLIGEVWLASGQSNMEWTSSWLRVDDFEEEVGKANLPNIRFFKVKLRTSETPQDDLDGQWSVCSPTVMQNESGLAYYFGKNIHESLDMPVGVIVDAWGGTPIEYWYSPEAFQSEPDLLRSAENLEGNMWWPATQPGWAYNAMTYPLGNFSIAGMLWYQGESNVFDPMTYAKKMEVLVSERRKQFGDDLPFYYVQIAPYRYDPKGENSAHIRDQQRLALEIPNVGMVVTSDIGDTTNIHPSNKRELGKRMGNLALKYHYKKIEGLVESPVFESAFKEEEYVCVTFKKTDGLYFSEAERGYFEVAEQDKVFRKVNAEIIDGNVRLDTREINDPVWVQFAFTNKATPVLFNKANLPASCFAPQKIK